MMKVEARIKTLKAFLVIGLVLFITGFILLFTFNKSYTIGVAVLGAMWTIIAYKALKDLKSAK